MLDSKAIGNKINDLRSKNKMSQDQMAEKLFVTRQAVSRWELGQSLPSIDSLLEMSRLFSVSFEDILCLSEKKTIDPHDLFNGHSREYVVKAIIRGDLKVDLGDVFYQFSPEERLQILQAIRDKELRVDIQELLPKLTTGENVYLNGGKAHYVYKK
ncbi:MAG: helix-turn-helix domain-containing protein [Bacilli bacterium]|jgi:transcriptional regulator with XRE-family HTH domain|nr:helix-turn-helix domain-containing protein [Bacilli bacterium]